MKKIVAAALSALIAITLSSCKKDDNDNILNTSMERFVYENAKTENTLYSVFDVDDSNALYILNGDSTGIYSIEKYDENGNALDAISIDILSFEQGTEEQSDMTIYPLGIDIYGGKIYILCDVSNTFKVYEYDTSAEKILRSYAAENFSNVEKMEANADGIYLIGAMRGGEYVSEEFTDENGNGILFECAQKIIECINVNGEFQRVETEYPAAFTARKNGGIIVYAFDKKGGYYFAEVKNNSPEKKVYNNSYGLLSDIDLFGGGNDIIVCGGSNHKLCAGTAEANSGISDVLENVSVYLPSDVQCNSNYIFFKSGEDIFSETEKVSRISAAAAKHKGKVNVISSQYLPDMPFSNGFEINSEQLSADMFPTKILTMSDSFDISCFSSEAGYAKNMQSSGAFYPLNEIEGVKEYIDGCFPYLKEACTNEKGQIWALPIRLDIPVIVYNKYNCENAGFDFENNLTLEGLYDIVYKAHGDNLRYDCIRFRFVESMLAQYLQNNDSFDTEQFRELAVFLKEKCSMDIFNYDPMIYSDMMSYNINKKLGIDDLTDHAEYDRIYFTLLHTNEEQTTYLSEDENISAAPLPKLSPEYKNNAVCTFLCINPGAGNLENAKNYISALTAELANKKNGMMLKSKSSYTDNDYCRALWEIYSEGQIYFAVPSSIYYEGFDSYCAGGTDLETFIRDADEKMKIYLWEKE